jgi:hypothetical protein
MEEYDPKQEHLNQLYDHYTEIQSLLRSYPYLIQPKFIIEHFRKQKINPVLCYQYASFIRDSYEQIQKSENLCFTRKVMGSKDDYFDVPYSFGDYLCIKKNKMFCILRQGFLNVTKENNVNSYSINQKFHVDLFDPKGQSLEKADKACENMIAKRKKNRSKKDIPKNEEFSFAVNQFFIKTFGWQDGIIISQLLYWVLKNKRETIFFSDLELSKRLYFDVRTIRNSKIWDQYFILRKKSKFKFKIRIDLNKLVLFIKRTKK